MMTDTETIRVARHLKEQILQLAADESDEQVRFRLQAAANRLESAARCASRHADERVAAQTLADLAGKAAQ